jgi:hypothetical protein
LEDIDALELSREHRDKLRNFFSFPRRRKSPAWGKS